MLTTNPRGSSAPLKSQDDSINTATPQQSPLSPARQWRTTSGNKCACDGLRARPGPATNKNVRALCLALNETCGSDSRPPVAYPPLASSRMLAVMGADRYRSRMNLEDHLGDIIGKARAMSGVSPPHGGQPRPVFPKRNCPRWKQPDNPADDRISPRSRTSSA